LHDASVRRLLGRHLKNTFAAARLSRVPAVVDAAIRAAARDQRTFDDLVEIGLGRGVITPRVAGGLVAGLVTDLRRRRPPADQHEPSDTSK
jgi:menaquinone-9 beta-reductase